MITQWTITRDCQAREDVPEGTNANAKGITWRGSPGRGTLTSEQIKNHPEAVKFRMLDDDGEICYYGYILGDNYLAPLDDFGTPNAGCTSIEVYQYGKWQAV